MDNLTTLAVAVISAITIMTGSGGVLRVLIKNRPSKALKESKALTEAKGEHEADRKAWREEKEEWRKEREEWRRERAAFSAERVAWAAEREEWEGERERMEQRHADEVRTLRDRVSQLERERAQKD